MFHLLLASAVEAETSFTEAVTPYIAPGFLLIGTIVVSLWTAHNRKRGAVENRAPDVNEIWVRSEADHIKLDAERRLRRKLEDLLEQVLRTFRNYVERTRAGGNVNLTTTELKVYNTTIPTLESELKE